MAQHNDLWRAKTENAIAQKIERAHPYSFNLSNYRSSLAPAQLAAWKDFAANYTREDDPSKTLEKQCRAIAAAASDELDELISGLDPRHTLELDIARQFLTGISPELFIKHPHLRTLQEVIASQQRTPRVKLKDVCDYEKGRFPTQATPEGPYPFVVTAADRKTADDFQIDGEAVCVPLISSTGHGKASMHRIHYEKGKFAVADLLFALRPKSPAELKTKFLYWVLSTRLDQLFVPLMKGTANVSLRLEDAVAVEIPMPPVEKQEDIVAELDRLNVVVESAQRIGELAALDSLNGDLEPRRLLGEIAHYITKGTTPTSLNEEYTEKGVLFIRSENVLRNHLNLSVRTHISETVHRGKLARSEIRKGDVLLNLVGASIGRAAVYLLDEPANCNQAVAIIRLGNGAPLKPEFLALWLNGNECQKVIRSAKYGGARDNLNLGQVAELGVPCPPVEDQTHAIETHVKMQLRFKAVSELSEFAKHEARRRINQIWET